MNSLIPWGGLANATCGSVRRVRETREDSCCSICNNPIKKGEPSVLVKDVYAGRLGYWASALRFHPDCAPHWARRWLS